MRDTLESIVLYRGNTLRNAFAELEVFGGPRTEAALGALLGATEARAALRARQEHYVERLDALDDGAAVLERLCGR
jgi:hypothetical protein